MTYLHLFSSMYPTTPCTPSTKTSRLSPLALPFLPTDTVIEGLTTVLLTRNENWTVLDLFVEIIHCETTMVPFIP